MGAEVVWCGSSGCGGSGLCVSGFSERVWRRGQGEVLCLEGLRIGCPGDDATRRLSAAGSRKWERGRPQSWWVMASARLIVLI